jgi:hypothetical protein
MQAYSIWGLVALGSWLLASTTKMAGLALLAWIVGIVAFLVAVGYAIDSYIGSKRQSEVYIPSTDEQAAFARLAKKRADALAATKAAALGTPTKPSDSGASSD